MRILSLARKDLKQMFQSWQTAFFLLIMPIGFTLMFGFMFGGFGGKVEDPRLVIGLLDADQSTYSQNLTKMIETSEAVRPVTNGDATEDSLRKQVEDGSIVAAVLIPAGMEDALLAGEPLPLTLIADDKNTSVNQTIENAVITAYSRLYGATMTAALSQESYQAQAAFASEAEAQIYFDEAVGLAFEAWAQPPITIENTYTGAETEEETNAIENNGFIHSSPGMMAQFAIAGLIGAAEILVSERRNRALARMLTTGISRLGILLGHFLAMTTIIFLQLVVLAIFGQIFLQLNYLASPLATLLLILVSATTNGALGLLIGAMAKTSDNAVVFSLVPMFIFAGIGGAWMPLEFTSEAMQKWGHLSPIAWMMDGFKGILARGAGVEDIWLSLVALLGFSLLFFALGAWRFKFE